jgi:hypothetical protein
MTDQFFGYTRNWEQMISAAVWWILSSVLFVCFFYNGCLAYKYKIYVLAIPFLSVSVALGLLFWWMVRFSPKKYSVGPKGISILRNNGKKILLPAHEVTSVEAVESDTLRFWVGFSSPGFCGDWGLFWNKNIRSFRGYWTNHNALVLIHRVKGLPFLLSPDNRDEFLACANQLLQR